MHTCSGQLKYLSDINSQLLYHLRTYTIFHCTTVCSFLSLSLPLSLLHTRPTLPIWIFIHVKCYLFVCVCELLQARAQTTWELVEHHKTLYHLLYHSLSIVTFLVASWKITSISTCFVSPSWNGFCLFARHCQRSRCPFGRVTFAYRANAPECELKANCFEKLQDLLIWQPKLSNASLTSFSLPLLL